MRDSMAKGGECVYRRESRKEISVSDPVMGMTENKFTFQVSQSLDNFAF